MLKPLSIEVVASYFFFYHNLKTVQRSDSEVSIRPSAKMRSLRHLAEAKTDSLNEFQDSFRGQMIIGPARLWKNSLCFRTEFSSRLWDKNRGVVFSDGNEITDHHL